MKKVFFWAIAVCLSTFCIVACNSPFTPRPKGYFQVSLPQHSYRMFNDPAFPYRFEYPAYAEIVRDTSFFGETTDNPYWINITFPQLQGKIYISYSVIGGKARYKVKQGESYVDSFATNTFADLIDGSYKLTYKHSSRASSIEDSLLLTPNGVSGIYFRVGGNAATANQFLLTDSVKHFLRGALYFDTTPNEDSLKPVNAFLKQDMLHLINTFEWKN